MMLSNFDIKVNGRKIQANNGETILETLTRNGITVPTLCHLDGLLPSGACRMCVVEVEGRQNLLTACSYPVEAGMEIRTHSPRVVQARKVNTELLLSNHPDDCLYCDRNGSCELQKFAMKLNVSERHFFGKKNKYRSDPTGISLFRDPAKCILCSRCIRVCEEVQGINALEFIGKGNKMQVGPAFNKSMSLSNCIGCGQCVIVCPTGALTERKYLPGLHEALHNPEIKTVIQCSPALMVTLAEEFGYRPGKDIENILYAVLRKIGFDYVFDASFAADLLVMEETDEFIMRLNSNQQLPMFTSDCSSWIRFVELFSPETMKYLSTVKSAQQIFGMVFKAWFAKEMKIHKDKLYSVSAVPCLSKKLEAQRVEMTRKGINDVDTVLTTRELAKLIRLNGIEIQQTEPELADNPFRFRSSGGKLFSVAGGHTEAFIRTLHFKLTGKEYEQNKITELRSGKGRKEYQLTIDNTKIGLAVINGINNVKELLKEIENGRKDIHYIEVMACTGGCVNGGGQPIDSDVSSVKARTKAIYEIDEKDVCRAAHKNPVVANLVSKIQNGEENGLIKEYMHILY